MGRCREAAQTPNAHHQQVGAKEKIRRKVSGSSHAKEESGSHSLSSEIPDFPMLFWKVKSTVENSTNKTAQLSTRKKKIKENKRKSVLEPGSIPTKNQRLVLNLVISTKPGR